ncbi:MAG TPA: hypothetical protein VMG35_30775 [Bryobacteraceae bacterium]|nr:hypothetical protein [Bryobacteraceae bacterium]
MSDTSEETPISVATHGPVEAVTVQSGDLQGLPDVAESDSQSVRELVEDGQIFEAEVVSAVENTPPPDSDSKEE